ncbi:hypothetical protein LCM20_08270 [Halobacillus litoralis]|uniref:hypothetical protein n=1 Tax=Halobacillus litoralis TaxID=45668 RepID=UPI001CD2612D|nr:hypothetical protein [Halobacillus litoralis]MCA0970578.1 hypothetical protein [Halobacillus litoralis]
MNPLKVRKKGVNQLVITLAYQFFNYQSIPVFSTEGMSGNEHGFLLIEDGLYVKLTIRKVTSQAPPNTSEKRLKTSVDTKRRKVNWTIDLKQISSNHSFKAYAPFKSPDLEGLAYSLEVTSGTQKSRTMNKRELNANQRRKDFQLADQYQYGISPNTDSIRDTQEYLAGSGSNLGRRRR